MTTAVDTLISKAAEYLPEDRMKIVKEAYEYAAKAHDGQMRKSGEPFIEHPLQTALYLAQLKLDPNALAAALLHDVMEDCHVPKEELAKKFGDDVARLVDGVTKLTKTELLAAEHGLGMSTTRTPDDNMARAASLRKMLMSLAEDIRVVLIKLADRLHNMRTLKWMPEEKRKIIAQETLDIYAPLAHRLGIWEIKWQLEDLAFQHLNPEAYKEISKMLSTKRVEREKYIDRVRMMLEEELEKAGIEAEVYGRPKHIYSIYKKAQSYATKNRTIGDIYDLFALRVLVERVQDCYAALGVIHSKWRPLPGQFDDYIANPKDNLYQSLHTAVLCEDALPVEVQIRTHEMHHLAEYGVAAHWLYKEGGTSDVRFEEKMRWLRQILEWQRDVSGAEEFVESFKTDIFKNQVFVYTPKGELKELPAGATPLDFAYRIHTDVGHRCIGAKLNGKLVPLHYQLSNGDTVEIMTSKTVRGPSLDWLNQNLGYVRTASAREKIRQWFNRQEKTANIQIGRDIFNKQFRRLNLSLEDTDVAKLMKMDSPDDLYAALGNGSLAISQVISKVTAQEAKPPEEHAVVVPLVGPASGIQVLGVGDLLTRMARCCNPIAGDAIIGYVTRGRGVTVHRNSCPNILNESEVERLVPVSWGKAQTLYPVRVRIEAWDRVGLLRDITALVSEEGINIAMAATEEQQDVSIITLTVYVVGIDQLSRLFSKLEGVEGVIHVSRTKAG
ncbi:MAG: bifunctional (p)ppGpp synthetase/guanosine-3',5'-bis(diphosphate) 3'-pyrophosphohydrolase [SAR202 cluster bacterium]|nr:bifunctional (p)ppGpp synthetase/guanosine-3',5'-bis(diphosphate) 3'-pyrophosphohydrolase [SAR202 cluster bacterium]